MKQGFEDIMARHPDPWNLNNYARFACLAHDKQKMAELMPRVYAAMVEDAWLDFAPSLVQCGAYPSWQ